MTSGDNPETFTLDEVKAALDGLDPEARAVVLGGLKLVAEQKEQENEQKEQENRQRVITGAAVNLVYSYDLWNAWERGEADVINVAAFEALDAIRNTQPDPEDETVKKTALLAAVMMFSFESWYDFEEWDTSWKELSGVCGVAEEDVMDYCREVMIAGTKIWKISDVKAEEREAVLRQLLQTRDGFKSWTYTEVTMPLFEDLRAHLLSLGVDIPTVKDEEEE